MVKASALGIVIAIGLACAACSTPPTRAAEVRQVRVEFSSDGVPVVGDLYLAHGASESHPGPAVIVSGAWMTVRQQMAARYARELAERGVTAMVFDYRGWGESGGDRRQYEDPTSKIADTRAAFEYLASRLEADAARIGGLGICASSGYMVHAALETPVAQSIALVAPWLHDREVVLQTYGGEVGVAELEAAGKAAEANYVRTGEQQFVPAASTLDPQAIMFGAPYYTEADRGMISAWRNQADPAFWEGWLAFDAIEVAPNLRQPFFMVHSEAAAIPQGAKRFYSQLTASKSQLWLEGVSQFDFYDRSAAVEAAVDATAQHFEATL